jgi:hypothetical protein
VERAACLFEFIVNASHTQRASGCVGMIVYDNGIHGVATIIVVSIDAVRQR